MRVAKKLDWKGLMPVKGHNRNFIGHEIIYAVSNSNTQCFLGTFAKLRKATISFVMSVCPSARNSAPTGQIYMEFDV
jgi:hypothetical protein